MQGDAFLTAPSSAQQGPLSRRRRRRHSWSPCGRARGPRGEAPPSPMRRPGPVRPSGGFGLLTSSLSKNPVRAVLKGYLGSSCLDEGLGQYLADPWRLSFTPRARGHQRPHTRSLECQNPRPIGPYFFNAALFSSPWSLSAGSLGHRAPGKLQIPHNRGSKTVSHPLARPQPRIELACPFTGIFCPFELFRHPRHQVYWLLLDFASSDGQGKFSRRRSSSIAAGKRFVIAKFANRD